MSVPQNLCYNCFSERSEPDGPCPFCGYDPVENKAKYPLALKAGSILNGQYIIGRVLGQGGFGITYLAFDNQLKVKVAIKEYLPEGIATRLPDTPLVSVYTESRQENFTYGAERFLDEARVLAKFIGNPNIAAVRSYFNENSTSYFVMDYIEGISFKSYIQNKGGRIDYRDALRVLVPVLRALSAVHREGFIHRDVTPDNIYITRNDEIKLLDFGSARYSLGNKSRSLDVILKAGYAPREQYIRRGKQGPYTDVYSAAACFYAAITGYLPPESLERIEEDSLVTISTRGIKIPEYLEDAILKGLEVMAEDRFQTADEFLAALEEKPGSDQLTNVPTSMDTLYTVPCPVPAAAPAPVSPPAPAPAPSPASASVTAPIKNPVEPGQSDSVPTVPIQSCLSEANPEPEPKKSRFVFTKKHGILAGAAAACIVLIISAAAIVRSLKPQPAASDPISTTERRQTASSALEAYKPNTAEGDSLGKAADDSEPAAEQNITENRIDPTQDIAPPISEVSSGTETESNPANEPTETTADLDSEKKAADEKAAAEKEAADKKAVAEKEAADKKAAAEKEAAAKKAAEEKNAAEKKAAEEKAAAKKEAMYCGDNLTWTYNSSDGTLTISGSGPMYNTPYNSSKYNDYDWLEETGKAKKLILPSSITSIGAYAFEGLAKQSVRLTLPGKVKSIEMGAFQYSEITEISIPASVKQIGEGAFIGSKLTDIYYSGTKEQWNKIKIDENYNDILSEVTIHYAGGSSSDKKAADEKAAADKKAADEKAAADKKAADKKAADKAAADKKAADEKAAADKKAADKKAEEEKKAAEESKIETVTDREYYVVTSVYSMWVYYTGSWKPDKGAYGGKPEGKGTARVAGSVYGRFDSGDTLSGNWVNGLIEGSGTYTSSDGSYQLKGNFIKGLKEGTVKEYVNGKYTGDIEFKNGSPAN